MTPASREWVQSGFLRVSAKTEVSVAPERIWEILSDPETWETWYGGLDTFERLSNEFGLGSRVRIKEWLFRSQAEIVEWEPGRAIGWTYVSSSFSFMLSKDAERIEIRQGDEPGRYIIEHSGRFSLNWLGWLLAPYALGNIFGFMYFDFRTAVRRLAQLAEHPRDET